MARWDSDFREDYRRERAKKNNKKQTGIHNAKYWRFFQAGQRRHPATVAQQVPEQCVSQKGRRSCRSTVVTSSCLRVNLVWSRFNFLDGWRTRAVRFKPGSARLTRCVQCIQANERPSVSAHKQRRLNPYGLQTIQHSDVHAHLVSFLLLLVTTTLESISGPLSHAEWERLILNIWQPCL